MTPISTLWLGAIHGLLVGLALEVARVAYLNYQMDLAARQYAETNYWADFDAARWEPLTPLVSMLVFALVAYVVCRYFVSRPQLLLSTWLVVGTVALAAGYFMSTSTPDRFSLLWLFGLVAVGYLMHKLWKSHPQLPSLLWPISGISALIVVALGVQLVGLFFHWPELRSPLTWLMGLVGIVAISAIFGVVVQFIQSIERKEV